MDYRTAFFALLVAVLGAIAALMVLPLLQFVLAAALLAFVLYPVHERLEPKIGARLSAISLTAFAILAAVVPVVIFSMVIMQNVLTFLNEFDVQMLFDRVRELGTDLGIGDDVLSDLEEQVLLELENVFTDAIELLFVEMMGLLNRSIQMGIGLMVLLFLLYYLLVDGRTFLDWLRFVFPLEDDVRNRLFEEIDVVTWAVIKSHVLVALVEGVLGGIGLYLLGVPNVAFWTVIMIIVSFLPAIGIWLVWGPAVVYLILVDDLLASVVLLLYGIAVLSIVDNYLRAVFVDRGSGLHPAVVLIGVIGGIYLLGIMGLFLGPVLLAVFKASLNVFGETTLATSQTT